MRQPEGEEHRLVATPGPPVEYVCVDNFRMVGGTAGEPLASVRHHFRRRIDVDFRTFGGWGRDVAVRTCGER
jgi:hypothetical protein